MAPTSLGRQSDGIPNGLSEIMPRQSEKQRPRLQHYKLDAQSLGSTLIARRKGLGLSLQQLSDQAGVSATTVMKLERGELTVQLDKFLQVMDQLGLPLTSVIGYDGAAAAKPLDGLSLAVLLKLEDDSIEEAMLLLAKEVVVRKARPSSRKKL